HAARAGELEPPDAQVLQVQAPPPCRDVDLEIDRDRAVEGDLPLHHEPPRPWEARVQHRRLPGQREANVAAVLRAGRPALHAPTEGAVDEDVRLLARLDRQGRALAEALEPAPRRAVDRDVRARRAAGLPP